MDAIKAFLGDGKVEPQGTLDGDALVAKVGVIEYPDVFAFRELTVEARDLGAVRCNAPKGHASN